MNELTPFDVAMNCQHVTEDADYICWQCTMAIVKRAEAAEDALVTMTAERDELAAQLKAAREKIAAFEVGSRLINQAISGGDEVNE